MHLCILGWYVIHSIVEFLSDPSPIIALPCQSVTPSSCSDLADVILACKDSRNLQKSHNLSLPNLTESCQTKQIVKIWSIFQSWSLLQILKLKFAPDVDVKVWSQFWSWSLLQMLKLKFGQDFKTEVWSRFWSWSLLQRLKLKFGHWSLIEILRVKVGQDFEAEVWSQFEFKACWSFYFELWVLNESKHSMP